MSYDFLTDPDITVNKSGFINQWLSGAQDPGIVAAFSGKSKYIYLLHLLQYVMVPEIFILLDCVAESESRFYRVISSFVLTDLVNVCTNITELPFIHSQEENRSS